MKQIRISGYGGQGVILSAMVLGKAAALYEDKHSTLIQAFGPEARGSSCSAQLIISDSIISYPYIVKSDILISMSKEAYKKFIPELKEDGILIYENELVKLDNDINLENKFGIPATRLAEDNLGKSLGTNMVMVGFITAILNISSKDNVLKAIAKTVPSHTIEYNARAFNLGFDFGKQNY